MDGHDILIFYSAEDQAYIADIPDFDMCSAHGPTPQAALEEVLLAYRAIVQTLEETGRPRPAPKSHLTRHKTSA